MSTPTSMRVILGTAGHIDHGKTTLVQRLTGVDTDRLPEEKRRGITIVLGFAPLELTDGSRVGVVDVPGHERFVKNMVAGAGGIDVALLVVAADEGIMPQTREHLEICQLLGIRRGLVALTKVDRAGPELAELALDDVKNEVRGTFLEGAPIIPCSSITGEGIDDLRSAITHVVKRHESRRQQGSLLLPIDRCFSMRGFGSIVTGTLLSGTLGAGDAVEVLPALQGRPITESVRVRGLQVFHEKVDRAFAGERTAVNLQGIELDRLALGQVLVSPGAAVPTRKLAVRLTYLKSRPRALKTGARILFHTGTALVEAGLTLIERDSLEPGESAFAHVLLRAPIATLPGQRFIARGFDAVENAGRTIAGGVILDLHPGRRKRRTGETTEIMSRLFALVEQGRAEDRLERALATLVRERGPSGIEADDLGRRLGITRAECDSSARTGCSREVTIVGDRFVDTASLLGLSQQALAIIDAFHKEHPFRQGMALAELASRLGSSLPFSVAGRAAEMLIETHQLERTAEGLRRPDHASAAGQKTAAARGRVLAVLDSARLEPPPVTVLEEESGLRGSAFRDLLSSMVRAGDVVHASGELYFARSAFDTAKARILEHIAREGGISTPQAKELIGVSRKFLIPLLEALDKAQVTIRVGEVRKARHGGGR